MKKKNCVLCSEGALSNLKHTNDLLVSLEILCYRSATPVDEIIGKVDEMLQEIEQRRHISSYGIAAEVNIDQKQF